MKSDKVSKEQVLGRVYIVAMTVYIMLPILIFFSSWLRLYFAIPSVVIIIFGAFTIIRNNWDTKFTLDGKHIYVVLILVALLTFVLVYMSGIGGYVIQKKDHYWRNGIFEALVNTEWPVLTDVIYADGHIARNGMVYYIGFWLPAAVFGKVFGIEAGYFFQFVWAILGVYLTYLSISFYLKKISLGAFVVFVFFSGLDILAVLIFQNWGWLDWTKHIEWWAYKYQYSSQITQLFWVFNQSIYGWVIFLFLLNQKNSKTLLPIWACGLLECSFPFVGMIPYLVYIVVHNSINEYKTNKSIKDISKNIFTISNIVVGGVVGIISFLYLKSNFSSQTVNDSFSTLTSGESSVQTVETALDVVNESVFMNTLDLISDVFVFLLIEIGIYALIICKDYLKKPLFWITIATLMVCPFIKVGYSADFVMRASIPALLMLCIFVIQSLGTYVKKTQKVKLCVLIVVLIIGAVTPIHELVGTISDTYVSYEKYGVVENKSIGSGIIRSSSGNFSGATEGSFFFTYLAREVDNVDLLDVDGKKVD